MSNNEKRNPEYFPDEKKVWRAVSATPCEKPSDDMPDGAYFIAIEELQGAWIGDGDDKEWEEADAVTYEWDEEYTNERGEIKVRTVSQETMRARRYVLKVFTDTGFVKNAYSGSYSGNRKYRQ